MATVEERVEERPDFSFGDQSVAASYDNVLVPLLFTPWATQLVERFKPWHGLTVLDLATGTGVVADMLAGHVGPAGQVTGADINAEMLALARQRCAGATPPVEFIEASAQSLGMPDASVSVVVCQQGFQFFPDKMAAATEIFRVLRGGGRVIVTTWCPVADCEYFGAICEALRRVGEVAVSDMMRVPFDFMPAAELASYFEASGFEHVHVRQEQLPFTIDQGVPEAVQVAYATPIGPKLRALPEEQQREFRHALTTLLGELSQDGQTMGRMASHVLSANKPG